MLELGPVSAPATDFLRLLVVPAFAWAAYRDVLTRRVPNELWYPLAALGIALLSVDGWTAWTQSGYAFRSFLFTTAFSVGLVVPLAYLVWAFGGFGGADAKALMVLAVVFPAYPVYLVPWAALPLVETRVGVFSLTVFTNTTLVALAFPLVLAVRNLLTGRLSTLMFLARPVPANDLPTTHGRLMEDADGRTRRGLDLDALRMYLRWRDCTLADLRADPETYRDPASLPATPSDPTDGAVTDGGVDRPTAADAAEAEDGDTTAETEDGDATDHTTDDGDDYHDPWGAAAFVEDVGAPYGTTAAGLRSGLEAVTERDAVWVSPGLPFVVPMFVGLVVALGYGDLLFGLLQAFGLV